MSKRQYQSFVEFWPYYVGEHSDPKCRALHFMGTSLAFFSLLTAVVLAQWWLLLAVPIVGYFIVRLYVIASLLDSLFITGMSSQSRDLIPQMLNLRVGFTLAIFASGLLMALAWLIGGRVSWRFLSRRRQRTLGLLEG